MAEVGLRMLQDEDFDRLFDMMRDPVAVRMAAFTPPDPDDRAAFDRRQARIRTLPAASNRAITVDGEFAGTVASFLMEGDTETTYWIDRPRWGPGHREPGTGPVPVRGGGRPPAVRPRGE